MSGPRNPNASDASGKRIDRGLALRLLQAQEDERRRIARLLHDDLGQTLTAAVLELEYARNGPDAAAVIDGVLVEIRRLLGASRDLSLHLRPALIDEEGLAAALDALVSRLCSVAGAHARLQTAGLERQLSPAASLTAYRIVQDATLALANARAGREISIEVQAHAEELSVRIKADAGPLTEQRTNELSLEDRVAVVDGRLLRQTDADGTVLIHAHIPLQVP